ncbi:hypothetical protein MP228_002092 [Amoeboaphelidium protococcarum]|nr:hypothetical protein MP228_002092 [Amoeboaphelidium protococcarum]
MTSQNHIDLKGFSSFLQQNRLSKEQSELLLQEQSKVLLLTHDPQWKQYLEESSRFQTAFGLNQYGVQVGDPQPYSLTKRSSSKAALNSTTAPNDGDIKNIAEEDDGAQAQDKTHQPTFTRKLVEPRIKKVRKVEPEADGSYQFKAKFGYLRLVDLGQIEYEDQSFHTDRYIFPLNYKVVREFQSIVDPAIDKVWYEATISKGEAGILFQVKSLETGQVFDGRSSSGAWAKVVQAVCTLRDRPIPNAIQGPDLYGFTIPEIAQMIQNLLNAEMCKAYHSQTFIEK